jgi:hypothetical protein
MRSNVVNIIRWCGRCAADWDEIIPEKELEVIKVEEETRRIEEEERERVCLTPHRSPPPARAHTHTYP